MTIRCGPTSSQEKIGLDLQVAAKHSNIASLVYYNFLEVGGEGVGQCRGRKKILLGRKGTAWALVGSIYQAAFSCQKTRF